MTLQTEHHRCQQKIPDLLVSLPRGWQGECRRVQELPAQCQIALLGPAGQLPVMPDPLETRRQGMQQEAADKLFR